MNSMQLGMLFGEFAKIAIIGLIGYNMGKKFLTKKEEKKNEMAK